MVSYDSSLWWTGLKNIAEVQGSCLWIRASSLYTYENIQAQDNEKLGNKNFE